MLHCERRKHKRYLVRGTAVVTTSSDQLAAELVDVGKGGVLVLAPRGSVKIGEQVDIRFAVAGYPVEIESKGRVVRVDICAIGIGFIDPPVELDEAVLWLEAEFLSALF